MTELGIADPEMEFDQWLEEERRLKEVGGSTRLFERKDSQ